MDEEKKKLVREGLEHISAAQKIFAKVGHAGLESDMMRAGTTVTMVFGGMFVETSQQWAQQAVDQARAGAAAKRSQGEADEVGDRMAARARQLAGVTDRGPDSQQDDGDESGDRLAARVREMYAVGAAA